MSNTTQPSAITENEPASTYAEYRARVRARLGPQYVAYKHGELDGLKWAAACATRDDVALTGFALRAPRVMGRDLCKTLDLLHGDARVWLPPLPGWTSRRMLAWPETLWIGARLRAEGDAGQELGQSPSQSREVLYRRGGALYRRALALLGERAPDYFEGWRDALISVHKQLRAEAEAQVRAERARLDLADMAQNGPERAQAGRSPHGRPISSTRVLAPRPCRRHERPSNGRRVGRATIAVMWGHLP